MTVYEIMTLNNPFNQISTIKDMKEEICNKSNRPPFEKIEDDQKREENNKLLFNYDDKFSNFLGYNNINKKTENTIFLPSSQVTSNMPETIMKVMSYAKSNNKCGPVGTINIHYSLTGSQLPINEKPSIEFFINDAYKNLIERCWSEDPKLRPTFDEIMEELKTNPEFITDKIDKNEYFRYIELIENSPKSFDLKKRNQCLNEILESENYLFYKSENFDAKRGPPYSNSKKELAEYSIELNRVINRKEKISYHLFKFDKEISSFDRNEIINLNRQLNILSQINHPTILNFIKFSSNCFGVN